MIVDNQIDLFFASGQKTYLSSLLKDHIFCGLLRIYELYLARMFVDYLSYIINTHTKETMVKSGKN